MKIYYKKIIFFLLFIISFFVFFNYLNYSYCLFDTTPTIVSRLNSAFVKIEGWLIKLATPAAAVAIATGVFMKKFSFGDEERIRIAKKIIRGSLFSYAFILTIDLILSAIQSLVT